MSVIKQRGGYNYIIPWFFLRIRRCLVIVIKSLPNKKDKMDKARESEVFGKDKNFKVVNCRYFVCPGPKNTQATFEAARERANLLKIKKILV